MLLLILSHTLIPCIHNFSHSSCSPLLFFPCAQVSCSFNILPCVCHVHLYRSICQNILALGDKIALCGVWWKDSGVYWYSFCFFSTISGKDLHQILVLSENLLQDFCSSCCNFWCWISRGVTVYHIFLMLKFGREAYYNVSHEVGLSVTSSF